MIYTSLAYTIRIVQQTFRGLLITIILLTRNVSSHKTDWILSELSLFALSCRLYRRLSSLTNKLEGECFLPLRNLYTCKQVACNVVVDCLLLSSVFLYCTLSLLVNFLIPYFLCRSYCYIFVYSLQKISCKQAHCFVFAAFAYHFQNTISIFVTIWIVHPQG